MEHSIQKKILRNHKVKTGGGKLLKMMFKRRNNKTQQKRRKCHPAVNKNYSTRPHKVHIIHYFYCFMQYRHTTNHHLKGKVLLNRKLKTVKKDYFEKTKSKQ